MNLIEREGSVQFLQRQFAVDNAGHAVFIAGEAGSGKTSLVNFFVKSLPESVNGFFGACDSLFIPRPLGPLHDVAQQTGPRLARKIQEEKDRGMVFTAFTSEIASYKNSVLVFEDVHWADEATIDFIKFFIRRIDKFKCLFLLTYRDDEIHVNHPLAKIFRDLPPANFSKLPVNRFSREAVHALANAAGYPSGDKLFALTGGNPFYVTEILQTRDQEIPSRVKDSILAVFRNKEKQARLFLEMFSILPSRVTISLAEQIDALYPDVLKDCIDTGIIIMQRDYLHFRHELYRITIEEQILPFQRRAFHEAVFRMMQNDPNASLSQQVHHAKFAEYWEHVILLAPKAAREAANLGAHREAEGLYALTLEHMSPDDAHYPELLELHAYECYLTNQMEKGIALQEKALAIWRDRNMKTKEGNALRFLSRMMWFHGSYGSRVEELALQAVNVLEKEAVSRELALAYSNLAQVNMLADRTPETLYWGTKAITLATTLRDDEVLTHALNNVGAVQLKFLDTSEEGENKLRESLRIALAHAFHEHAARAYTNLSHSFLLLKQFKKAEEVFTEGIKFCEERSLDSWTHYMTSKRTEMFVRNGNWKEAERMATWLYDYPGQPIITRVGVIAALATLRIRQGKFEEAESLIEEGERLAVQTEEAQRIVPKTVVKLEWLWHQQESPDHDEISELEERFFSTSQQSPHYSDLAYWMNRCGMPVKYEGLCAEPVRLEIDGRWQEAATMWEALECPFELALALGEGDLEKKKLCLQKLDALGAVGTRDMLRAKMKRSGISGLPRGLRESTRNNPVQLTSRHLDILQLLQIGCRNHEIAEKLFISPKTVDHHMSAIFLRLGVDSRAKAVEKAKVLGILQ